MRKQGYAIFYDRFLLIQTEQMGEKLPQAMKELLGVSVSGDWRADTVETRSYGERYRDFLNWVTFPDDYLDRMYNTKYVKHFYTPKQIRDMRAQWQSH